MTLGIGFLLALLAGMVYLFLTEKLPIDLTAFLGLVILVFAGYVPVDDAFSGFSSSAVITMLSIFIVSASLLQTGVADALGGRIHRWVGSRELPLIATVMIAAGVLSAFMNNIAATAVLMPAVASLGRSAGLSPARLFMPLSFGAILGGTTTLVGTPPNILAGAMLRDRGLEPFELFDFTPFGLALLGGGVVYMLTVGRRLLPAGGDSSSPEREPNLAELYRLHESTFALRIPTGSRLDGVTLGEARLGTSIRGQIVSIAREGNPDLVPTAETVLLGGDELLGHPTASPRTASPSLDARTAQERSCRTHKARPEDRDSRPLNSPPRSSAPRRSSSARCPTLSPPPTVRASCRPT